MLQNQEVCSAGLATGQINKSLTFSVHVRNRSVLFDSKSAFTHLGLNLSKLKQKCRFALYVNIADL